MTLTKLCRFWRESRAATAIEFALLLPTMLLIIGAVFEYSRVLLAQNMIRDIVDEAARTGVVRSQTDGEVSVAIGEAVEDVPGVELADGGISVDSSGGPLVVSVTATVEMYLVPVSVGNFTIRNEYPK